VKGHHDEGSHTAQPVQDFITRFGIEICCHVLRYN
jgi:hypothetical protein